jgi:hypothetical protein
MHDLQTACFVGADCAVAVNTVAATSNTAPMGLRMKYIEEVIKESPTYTKVEFSLL